MKRVLIIYTGGTIRIIKVVHIIKRSNFNRKS